LNRVALRLRGKDPVLETFSQQRDQMYADQLDDFESAVFEKKRASLLATGADGLKALAVCDAARRSSRTGKTEKVAY
jgi:predicted dehydrogenase